MVHGADRFVHVAMARGVDTDVIAEESGTPWLVVGDPRVDNPVELIEAHFGIVEEPIDRVAVHPAAFFMGPHREVPMIERDGRLDAFFTEACRERLIERHPSWIELTLRREDPWPGDRETIRVDTELFDVLDVFF